MSWIADVPGVVEAHGNPEEVQALIFAHALQQWVAQDPGTGKEEDMRRNGVDEQTLARLAAKNAAGVELHGERFRDDAWGAVINYPTDIRLDTLPQIVTQTFCHSGMHIATKAFEFKNGFLTFGTFYPGLFRERGRPMPRTFLDNLHATQDDLADGDEVVAINNAEIVKDLAYTHMPWLGAMIDEVERRHPPPTPMTLVIDSDYNALLLRGIRGDELERYARGFAFDEGEEYLIPMGAIAPWIGVTMWAVPAQIETDPPRNALTPVLWVHLYDRKDPVSVPERDGSFRLHSYLKYENKVESGRPERLPVYCGGSGSFITLVPRFDRNRELVADMDWMTVHGQREGHEGPAQFLSPQQVKAENLVKFELGIWAELDYDKNRWRHTATMAHWHKGDERISCVLELDSALTTANEMITFKCGPVAFKIDKPTDRLSQGDLVRGDDVMEAIWNKVESSLDIKLTQEAGSPFRSWFLVELTEHHWQGHYPARMGEVDPPNPSDSYWYPDVHSQQGRLYMKYLMLHDNFVEATGKATSDAVEAFEDDLKQLDSMAEKCFLDKWVRDAHRAKERKCIERLQKLKCVPKVKVFLAYWDNWLRRQVAEWPENEAQLRGNWSEDLVGLVQRRKAAKATTKVRAGMALTEFAAFHRAQFSEDCTVAEWQDAIARAIEREKEKDEQERLAAKREARKQEDLAAKLDKRAKANEAREAREKAEDEARRAAQQAEADAELAATLAALQVEEDAERALLAAYEDSDGGYETFEEYKAAKAREAAEEAAAVEKARLEALAAENAAASERRNKEARAAKEAEKAAHAAEREARRKKEEAERAAAAEAKKKTKAAQAKQVSARAQEAVDQAAQNRQAAEQRDARANPGGGRNRRERGGGNSSGADAARAAIEDQPRGGKGRGRGGGGKRK